jgi:hypothetical protein
MDKPKKEVLDSKPRTWLHKFTAEFQREDGFEPIAIIYAAGEETSIMMPSTFSEAEQGIIAERVLPAVLDAGREIVKFKRSKLI